MYLFAYVIFLNNKFQEERHDMTHIIWNGGSNIPADLNEGSVENALIYHVAMRFLKPLQLIVSLQDAHAASILLRDWIYRSKFPHGVKVDPYLPSHTWGILAAGLYE